MPDLGTARADFPGGDTRQLWSSIQRILQLPSETRLFTGHDYRPDGRMACWESTIADQKATNLHLRNNDKAGFIKFREERDHGLPMPTLILPALRVNLAVGRSTTILIEHPKRRTWPCEPQKSLCQRISELRSTGSTTFTEAINRFRVS